VTIDEIQTLKSELEKRIADELLKFSQAASVEIHDVRIESVRCIGKRAPVAYRLELEVRL
jgi:hypothetical protein